jgi:hypothetical protein
VLYGDAVPDPSYLNTIRGPAGAAFSQNRIAQSIFGQRLPAIVRALQVQSARQEGGVSGQRLGGGYTRGADLAARTRLQAALGARYAGKLSTAKADEHEAQRRAKERFLAEHDQARAAEVQGRADLAAKIAELGGTMGVGVAQGANRLGKHIRGVRQQKFDDLVSEQMAQDEQRDAAELYAFETLGYDPYKR